MVVERNCEAKPIRLIDNNLWHKVCPLCQSSIIYNVGMIPYPESVLYSSTLIKLKNKAELWRCHECRSGFVQNAVNKEDSEVLYKESDSNKRWVSKTLFEDSKTEDVVIIMKKLFSESKTILDIGCNTGELLDYSKEFGCITYGIEYSSTSTAICLKKRHKIICDVNQAGFSFDIITAFDIVEHLTDVNGFFNKCYNSLSPLGKLVILTGNINSLPARLAGSRWWYSACPEHIILPSKLYLSSLTQWNVMLFHSCYNGKAWKFPFVKMLQSSVRGFLARRYSGYPAFSPDHMFLTLQPKSNVRVCK